MPFEKYSQYSSILDNLAWHPTDAEDVRRVLYLRKQSERLKLQVLYDNGVTKTLNKTMFHIKDGSSFRHRMCAEDHLQIYRSELNAALKGGSFSMFFHTLYKFGKLRVELMKEHFGWRLFRKDA